MIGLFLFAMGFCFAVFYNEVVSVTIFTITSFESFCLRFRKTLLHFVYSRWAVYGAFVVVLFATTTKNNDRGDKNNWFHLIDFKQI